MSGDNATVCLLSDSFLFWSFNSRQLSIKSFVIDFKISFVLIFDISLKDTKDLCYVYKTSYDANISLTTSMVVLTECSNYTLCTANGNENNFHKDCACNLQYPPKRYS